MIKGEAPELKADMVFDFLDIKPIVKDVCDSLDHKVLLPKLNSRLEIHETGDNYQLMTPDKSQFSLPKSDVLLLPISNTSAERLAIYICERVNDLTKEKFNFSFNSLEIEVEETPGQSAVYLHKGEK